MNGLWMSFWRLSGRERRDFFQGLVLLPAAVVWLRMFSFGRVQRVAKKWRNDGVGKRGRDEAAMFAEAYSSSRMMDAAARYGMTRGNCLSQSLALWWMLRYRGMPVQLRIGARKADEEFEAHAWVEMLGRAINDSDNVSTEYSPFDGPIPREMAARK